MKKILMVLTRDRQDCVSLCLRLHERAGSFTFFDQVVFLLNGVSPQHMAFVDDYIQRHPGVNFDKILGDGSRPRGISDMQNRCIAKYPGAFYCKTDEDVFVPEGWPERMWAAYEAHRNRDDLALITPLIPNNAYGLHELLTRHYPDLLKEHQRRFGCAPSPEAQGLTWQSPAVGEWATRSFLDLNEANRRHRALLAARGEPQHRLFTKYFSIGCIGYDFRHVERMGGIPWNDEPGWCTWIEQNRQSCVLDQSQIVLHYTFFVQQEWLDRSSLLEDLRRVNAPELVGLTERLQLDRAQRRIRQIPGILKRRSAALLGRGNGG
jgi:hypothetical protein